jgi:hypothetical protein
MNDPLSKEDRYKLDGIYELLMSEPDDTALNDLKAIIDRLCSRLQAEHPPNLELTANMAGLVASEMLTQAERPPDSAEVVKAREYLKGIYADPLANRALLHLPVVLAAYDAQAAELATIRAFKPDAAHINGLPEPLREYIYQLETRCDPAGDVQTIASLRDQREELLIERAALQTLAIDRWRRWQDAEKMLRAQTAPLLRLGRIETRLEDDALVLTTLPLEHGKGTAAHQMAPEWCEYCEGWQDAIDAYRDRLRGKETRNVPEVP